MGAGVSIPSETLKNTCKLGQGKDCCRYILSTPRGFECGKLTSLKETIDEGVDKMNAKGDNCNGLE